MLGIGDLLKVSVLGAPDSDQEVRVAADGTYFEFHRSGAGGGTDHRPSPGRHREEVGRGWLLHRHLRFQFLPRNMLPRESRSLGEVQKPGVYPCSARANLFDVLSLAGGTTPKAGKLISITHRDTPADPDHRLPVE